MREVKLKLPRKPQEYEDILEELVDGHGFWGRRRALVEELRDALRIAEID